MIFGSEHWETGKVGSWNTEEAILWFLDRNIETQEIKCRRGYLMILESKHWEQESKYRRSYLMIFWSKRWETGKLGSCNIEEGILWCLDQNIEKQER